MNTFINKYCNVIYKVTLKIFFCYMIYLISSVKFFSLQIIDKINYYFGRKFFRNFNPLSYNLFNLIYKKNISNKLYLKNDFISSYHKLGFAKLGKVDDQNINNLLISLKKNNPNICPGSSFSYNYKIEEDTMDIIKKIINSKLLKKLEVLQKYYNLKIALVNLKITRNYYDPNSNSVENYSNFFHSDGYLFNLFKIFINLEDVDESKGPLTIVKKEKSKEFINFYSYDKRKYCSIIDQTDNFFYKNVGQKGDIFLCNTTELLHKAGDIEKNKSRDILFLEFVAYPFENSIHLYSFKNIFDSSLNKKFAKIKGIKNLINFYFLCQKNKFN